MKRLMSVVVFVIMLPGFVSADVYFTRPTPLTNNSQVTGKYDIDVLNYCSEFDDAILSMVDNGVDNATVFADETVSISTGSVTSSFIANILTTAPQQASTISGSLFAESMTEAVIDEDGCFTEWNGGPHGARADFSDTFTIDGDVPGTPVTIFYTFTIVLETHTSVGASGYTVRSQFYGPGFDGIVSQGGLGEYNEGSGAPTIVSIDDTIIENGDTLTTSLTFNLRYDDLVVGDTFHIENYAWGNSWGHGELGGSARGTATFDWEATVVPQ